MKECKKILCVDDEPTVLSMHKLLLESAGFYVLTALSGSQAIAIFESEEVDCVVMDYWMAGMNGITAANIMKRIRPSIHIVFLSAYNELPGETVGVADAWIKKGEVSPEGILSRLGSILRMNNLGPHREAC